MPFREQRFASSCEEVQLNKPQRARVRQYPSTLYVVYPIGCDERKCLDLPFTTVSGDHYVDEEFMRGPVRTIAVRFKRERSRSLDSNLMSKVAF
jgi:hypothetical protein